MIRNAILGVCILFSITVLHAMREPERGSLKKLRAEQEGLRRLKNGVKITSVEERNYNGILLQYVVEFQTGSIGTCTYARYDRYGFQYTYWEKGSDNRVLIRRDGQDAKLLFDEYQSFYRRLAQR
ncbi:MAG TPA: hypothetical protein VGT41_06655 [Candidatus Babeliales bacterium]|nr:hypothetical protein [Candidatus Babeliales bacterium]